MRLIFVRHGEPDYVNDCLTENGILQAKATAERLKKEDIKAVYSSPNGRARETASFTAQNHGLEVQTLDFMHEIDWGDKRENAEKLEDKIPFDGHPWTLGYQLLYEHPELAGSDEWAQHHYFKDNKCIDCYEKIANEIDTFLKGYGIERKGKLYYASEDNNDTIALFAHGGSGAVLFSHILSLPLPFVLTALPYGVCSVTVFALTREVGDMILPRIEVFNDMGHIDKFTTGKLMFEK
jgi:probable phosphoglycerate mutase